MGRGSNKWSHPGVWKDRRSGTLQEVLERADGPSEATSSSQVGGRSKAAACLDGNPSSGARRLAQTGPGLGARPCTARAWVEHRSMLQPYQGPIRHAWTLAGIADALAEGETDRARSIAMLGLAALDQAAVDSGSWRRWSPVRPFGRLPEPGPWRLSRVGKRSSWTLDG